jgi:SAM-dependent methyltransferase
VKTLQSATRPISTSPPAPSCERRVPLAARLEPFDSYWQAPADVEKGYRSFQQFYRSNYLKHLPTRRDIDVLVVSCGPGYFVSLLNEEGYSRVQGIDSDPAKIAHARRRHLNCEVAEAFPFVEARRERYDLIICEQELNHLTRDEVIRFLELCRRCLRPGGHLFVYGLNGANPLVGAENLAHNIDHFHTFTEYSLNQVLELTGFEDIRLLPWKLYVFWINPVNYVGWALTGMAEWFFRGWYLVYGKKVKILSKKIAAVCRKPA